MIDAAHLAGLAESSLAAFEDLSLPDAAYLAQWAFLDIWEAHTSDPVDIETIDRIKRRLNPALDVIEAHDCIDF